MPNVSKQKNVHATRFVEYVCLQVLPVLSEFGDGTDGDLQLELLKLLAEMVGHCTELSSVEQCTANIYDCLLASLLLACTNVLRKPDCCLQQRFSAFSHSLEPRMYP